MSKKMLKEFATVFQLALEEFAKRHVKTKYTKAEVSRMLGTSRYLLDFLIAAGKIPDVSHGTSLRRYYDDADLVTIKNAIGELDTNTSFYSQRQTAPLLGLTIKQFQTMLNKRQLPRPTRGKTRYKTYSAADVEAMKTTVAELKAVRRSVVSRVDRLEQAPRFCCTRVAKLVGVTPRTLYRYREAGLIPGPTQRNSRRKYYSGEDVEALREFFSEPQRRLPIQPADRAAVVGCYSVVRAARYLGVPLITFNSWVKKGRLPKPSHVISGHLYYPRAELDGFRVGILADYFAKRAAGVTKRGRKRGAKK